MNNNKDWWDSLSLDWKVSLIENLMRDEVKELSKELILERFEKSNYTINDIVNMQSLTIDYSLAIDLTPVFKLKKLNDFYIEPPGYDIVTDNFICIYPKQLRGMVKELNLWHPGHFNGDFKLLNDFVNLRKIHFQSCQVSSLEGIQYLEKLEKVTLDQGNFFTDLSPLKGMKIKWLDLSFSYVTDLSPLIGMPLETLIITYTWIEVLSPLMQIPTLEFLRFTNPNIDCNKLADIISKCLSDYPSLPDTPWKIEYPPESGVYISGKEFLKNLKNYSC
jgi:hypothetical protein